MVLQFVRSLVRQYEEGLPHADPRTRHWLLVNNSPVYVWALSALYLLLVAVGPKLMQSRQPLELRRFLVVYNFGLVILSVYMVIELLLGSWEAGYSYVCYPYNDQSRLDPKELRVAKVLWWYFFSKAIELMDTVLMILRKKNNQVTFLHVFHHLSMLNIWWWVMMFIPGGQSLFGPLMNSIIHVVMYSYYFLSSFPSLQGKLWWKKYLTKLQLAQFGIVFIHSFNTVLSTCDFPQWGANLLSGYMLILIVLFANFYIQSYLKRSSSKSNRDFTNNNQSAVTNGYSHSNGYHDDKKKSI